ncbi:MAG: DUF2721 domain-containing protein [Gemmatimonadaceae bacterium]
MLIPQLPPDTFTPSITHVIQLALAPVFLFSGVAALLNVLTTRLGRIIDRARQLEEFLPDLTGEHKSSLGDDIATLSQRAKLVNRALSLSTTSALLVCTVVAVLFTSTFFERDASTVIAILFIGAMLCLIAALIHFMREIRLATLTLRSGKH